ncbi:P-loop containing nucleoside triphosphate hydrolases superfamily protein [Actinidia rufa]|uniref:P-loop containing nucleoside triphosphate hydrolases superfamily protein n=1 Tax=Actinidia rufa TaxID=165716 RepID=A0A7J0EUF5_9ERIC|nr:P-loop containing nucleoside triphosphate hydrolases superfamily protein [Actinidia rufa]
MADDFCLSIKDTLIAKAPKKSPLVLRMIVLTIAMVCGLYICSFCIKQISTRTNVGFSNFQVIEKPCEAPNMELWEKVYVHYPKPKTFSRDECECNPVRYFAILSTQRSGSGWFETLLNSHTNISSNGEIFSVKFRRSNISTIVETLDKIYNLDWLTSASKNECTAAVGLKWMLNQAEILARYKPTVNLTLLIPNLRQVEEMVAKALEYFKSTRHIILYYEDIIKNRSKLIEVQDFLKVPQMDLKSRQVKIHKGSLSQRVENWDDIEKALKGTPYESFLHEDYKI